MRARATGGSRTGWQLRGRVASALASVCVVAAPGVDAQTGPARLADLATLPISGGAFSQKANVMYVLDDSASMRWSFVPMPGQGENPTTIGKTYTSVAFRNHLCNPLYFDPDKDYPPPLLVDNFGAVYPAPDARFEAAHFDYYLDPGRVVNLATEFRAIDEMMEYFVQADRYDQRTTAHYYVFQGAVPGAQPTLEQCSDVTRLPAEGGDAWRFESAPPPLLTNNFRLVRITPASPPELRTKFANWYSYYRTRMLSTKTAVSRAFANLDQRVRVGFMTINNTFSPYGTDDFRKVQEFDLDGKRAWLRQFHSTVPSGGTPLQRALATAGQYFANTSTQPLGKRPAGLNDGGTHQPIQTACQPNFAIVSSDGAWNTSFGHTVDGQPLGDADGDGVIGTLADVAQHFYDIDLRKDLADKVPRRENATQWDDNPRQHMSTFTIGFGLSGNLAFRPDYLDAPSGDYVELLAGRKRWWSGELPTAANPNRGDARSKIDDMWHAAVNGRGRAYLTNNAGELEDALLDALLTLSNNRASGGGAGLSVQELGSGDMTFRTSYTTKGWIGDIAAFGIGADGTTAFAPRWNAGPMLDDLQWDQRRIYFWKRGESALRRFEPSAFSDIERTTFFGKPFEKSTTWRRMSPAQRTAVADGREIVEFLRGKRTLEGFVNGRMDRLFRRRVSVLGDIVNSVPVYVQKPAFEYADAGYADFVARQRNRQAVILVGANDGMLHAFHAAGPKEGQEAWAYVPRAMLSRMWQLADASYDRNHQFFVDGTPAVGDVKDSATQQWKTIAVGGFNNGGSGIYAVDVTDTENPKPMWEFGAGSCYTPRAVSNTDCNLGKSYGAPVIAKLPPADGETEGRWVVLVTSGYNNTSLAGDGATGDGNGRVYVIDAATGQVLQVVETFVNGRDPAGIVSRPNNLGPLAGWVDDARTDNTLKRVYAGDMLGNVWRWTVSSTGLSAAYLMMQVTGPGPSFEVIGGERRAIPRQTRPQPITTRPEVALVDGQPFVYVATGRLLGTTDLDDDSVQTMWAIRDQLGSGNVQFTDPRAALQQVKMQTTSSARTTTLAPCSGGCARSNGWYVDLDPGERVTNSLRIQLGAIVFPSNLPGGADCAAGGTSWLNYLNMATGAPLPGGDLVGGGVGARTAVRINEAMIAGVSLVRTAEGRLVAVITTVDSVSRTQDIPVSAGASALRRINWREVVQ